MDDDVTGQWAVRTIVRSEKRLRVDAARIVGRWHLVQSTIADRIVTKCGKEMKRSNGAKGRMAFRSDPGAGGRLCRTCSA